MPNLLSSLFPFWGLSEVERAWCLALRQTSETEIEREFHAGKFDVCPKKERGTKEAYQS